MTKSKYVIPEWQKLAISVALLMIGFNGFNMYINRMYLVSNMPKIDIEKHLIKNLECKEGEAKGFIALDPIKYANSAGQIILESIERVKAKAAREEQLKKEKIEQEEIAKRQNFELMNMFRNMMNFTPEQLAKIQQLTGQAENVSNRNGTRAQGNGSNSNNQPPIVPFSDDLD
ncbi:hypothetical protein EDEG_03515 [Edhazardia aedis USNM 41457]|uniref:Uncharacterized protein n=1 Tax=Edhazardia aedis (strain USNM 41457) TaxID=1003232 RepID=J9D2H3_EDHAE|nr:hypothetical protein EDEG_03515 [Edhazardia aedis USNM 41457]|eukprot:EJW02031.1 hypothetical protein EDEG_03515 [Edhazardia aedis USNM 41457]